MKTSRLFFVVIILMYISPLRSQETIPPYYWANTYIDYLKVRGYFPSLSVVDRPFERQEIARQLLLLDWKKLERNGKEQQMVALLYKEFAAEIQYYGNRAEGNWSELFEKALQYLSGGILKESGKVRLKAGAFGEFFYDKSDQSRQDGLDLDLHTQLGFFWKDRITVYNNMRIFSRADSNYIGKEFQNLYAYTEQGYVSSETKWIKAKFGRDFKQIGPGRSGQLLLSGNSRTFDMYDVAIGRGLLQFSFWGIQLNRRKIPGSDTLNVPPNANRYLNGHRLSINIKNRYFFGLSEVIVYGGPYQGWELGYMNPFQIYYGYSVNRNSASGNSFLNLDWDIYFRENMEFYGEFLIDDIQFEKKSPQDLEPNEFGFLLGFQWANVGLAGTLFNTEYIQVRNRTYNAPFNDWEKYLHRNEVIGYFRGNNFWSFYLSGAYWLFPTAQIKLFTNIVKQGEGSVAGEFN
ncbi:MAG: capsule assembly Wzi family protein, partial [Calditrichia bacterium]